MPTEAARRQRTFAISMAALALILSVAGSISLFTVTYQFALRNQHRIKEIKTLTCKLDLAFGLDHRLPPAQLKKLRPSQLAAVEYIINQCPELQRQSEFPH